MSRSRLARDRASRRVVDALLAQGCSIGQIVQRLGPDSPARSAIGRYVRDYRQLLEQLTAVHHAQCGNRAAVADPASLERTRMVHNAQAMLEALHGGATDHAEAELRANPPPEHQRRGASQETITRIKHEILGIRHPEKPAC